MPGIAIYEVLQTVVSKEEALQLIHGYVNAHAQKYHVLFHRLLKLPGLYHKMPGIFAKGVEKKFGFAAGFQAIPHEATKDVIRFDMVRCPYHDAELVIVHPQEFYQRVNETFRNHDTVHSLSRGNTKYNAV